MTLADDILRLIQANPQGLSDADLAARLGKLHQHVNQTCARLAARGLLYRDASQRLILNRPRSAEAAIRPQAAPGRGAVVERRVVREAATLNRDDPREVASMTWVERVFTHIGPLALERDHAGSPLTFMPQGLYTKAGLKVLNRHGNGPFCRFRLPAATPTPGIYVLTEDRRPVYVGICEDLARRWGPTGYGSISPVNCFVGGQPTNCKINSRVLAGTLAGRIYEVWFHEADDGRRAIEVQAIRVLAPTWNGTR